jgi:putative flippase GtrA
MSAILRSWPSVNRPSNQPNLGRRWLVSCCVGGMGIAVQLSTLAALTAVVGLHYLPATGLAVEAAILHNFLWHEHWTWSDRAAQDTPGRWRRLGRFHITNGVISLCGNLVAMHLLVGTGKLNYTLANIISIALCSVLNFLASDRLVFTRRPARSVTSHFPRACRDLGGPQPAQSSGQAGTGEGVRIARVHPSQSVTYLLAQRGDRIGPSSED